ncbi:MAG: DUF4339 domain-containing protein [Bacteroidota bacterium]
MPLYFIMQQNRQMGPYEREDLKKIHLEPETLVWRYGFASWRAAGSIEELSRYLPPSFNTLLLQEEEPLEAEPVPEEQAKAPLPLHTSGYVFASLFLLISIFCSGFAYTNTGVVILTSLAAGSWWSLQQFFKLVGDESTAKALWSIIGAYAIYLIAYLLITDTKGMAFASQDLWEVGYCYLSGGCSGDAEKYLNRLVDQLQLIRPWLMLLTGAVILAAIQLWRSRQSYGPKLTWLAWTTLLSLPVWMFVHLADSLIGTTSITAISSILLGIPYVVLFLFLMEMDA